MTKATRYENTRLYCLTCQEQPTYFLKVLSWDVSQVTPDGTHVHMLEAAVAGFRCSNCDGEARWGWELNGQ